MKIMVFEVGETRIDADPDHQEPAIRDALAGGDLLNVMDVIGDWTDTERSDISTDDYAIVFEDNGTLLCHGWLTGNRAAEAPPQARPWLTGMSAKDRAASFGDGD
jgi:hypothetical protein